MTSSSFGDLSNASDPLLEGYDDGYVTDPQPTTQGADGEEQTGAPKQPEVEAAPNQEGGGILGSLGNALNAARGGAGSGGADNWMDSLTGDLRDAVDNAFGGDQFTREELADKMKERRSEHEEWRRSTPVLGQLDEVSATLEGGIAGAIENGLESAEWVGDFTKTVTGFASEADNVFGDLYENAAWDLGMAENQTAVGGFAREALSMYLSMKVLAIGKLGAIGQGSIQGRLAAEAARGALVDFLINPEESNLSNLLGEASPGLKDTFLTALAHESDDNSFIRRLKNTVEGGIFGLAVDGIGELVGALRSGRKVLLAGGTEDEAAEAVVKAMDAPTVRPGAEARQAEEMVNGGSPNRPPMWEPNERAAKTSEFSGEQAAKSQAELESYGDITGPGSADPVLTDAAFEKILGPRQVQISNRASVEALEETIRRVGSTIDVDRLSADLGQSWEETVGKALDQVNEFLGSGGNTEVMLRAMKEGDATLPFYMTRQGVVATKTLIKDTAIQINELAEAAADVGAIKGDAFRQNELMFSRMRSLLRMHKQAAIHYGSGLNTFRIGSIDIGKSTANLDKQLQQIDTHLTTLQDGVAKGDAKSIREVHQMSKGLALTGGDPSKQMGFWALGREFGYRQAVKMMYNSMLSGPITQTRNIIGNAATTILRPVATSAGYLTKGQGKEAVVNLQGTFFGFRDSLDEAWLVAKKSFDTNMPISEGAKFDTYGKETAQQLADLKALAKTPGELGAVKHLEMMHDFANLPLMTLPTRTMTATDDFFKTLVARMELKRQAVVEVGGLEDTALAAKKYADLAQKSFGINGEIIDTRLLNVAKEATFQQDLTGAMRHLQQMSEHPLGKYALPFVKTPWNIIEYSATYIPGLRNFTQQYRSVLEGTDEAAKAMMRGRVALGYMTVATGLIGALTGGITGAGDADPKYANLRNAPKYSINVGGIWVSYQNIEGLAPILGAIADLSHVAHKMSFNDYQAAAAQIMYSVAAATTDRSFLAGLSSAMNVVESIRKGRGGVLQRAGIDAINNLIPFSGARRQLGKAISPLLNDINTRVNELVGLALQPGRDVVPQIDVLTGEPKDNPNDIRGWGILNNFLPFNVMNAETDPLRQRLLEVGFDMKAVVGETLNGMKLTPEQQAKLSKHIADAGLKKNLEKVVNAAWFDKDYQAWLEARRMGKAGPMEDSRWYRALQSVYRDAEAVAKARFAAEDKSFRDALDEHRRRKARERTGVYGNLQAYEQTALGASIANYQGKSGNPASNFGAAMQLANFYKGGKPAKGTAVAEQLFNQWGGSAVPFNLPPASGQQAPSLYDAEVIED